MRLLIYGKTTEAEVYRDVETVQFVNQENIKNGCWLFVWEHGGSKTESDYAISFDPKTETFILVEE